MIRSMTGFGRGEAPLAGAAVTAELRSVNSRHLDVRVRVPRELAELEAKIRECVGACFARGQLDVAVRLPNDASDAPPAREVDLAAARAYVDGAAKLSSELGVAGALSPAELLALPGVVVAREPELEPEEATRATLAAVDAACRQAVEMREREGASLDRELRARLEGVLGHVARVSERADEIRRGLRERLGKRLATLAPELELDPGRLEQEVVLYADRQDVTEELVRLGSHGEQFRETLEATGPVGRKLEFLLQELGREVNTIGSKGSDASVTRHVVEMKTELEKLREQVLNVE